VERKWRSIRTSPVGERMKRDWIITSNSVCFDLRRLSVGCWLLVVGCWCWVLVVGCLLAC
jgi:hypothetical protein